MNSLSGATRQLTKRRRWQGQGRRRGGACLGACGAEERARLAEERGGGLTDYTAGVGGRAGEREFPVRKEGGE